MIYYAIRHKASGEFMPQLKKNRGYSHWNPSNSEHTMIAKTLGVPRLLDTRRRAARCIHMWANNPNSRYAGYTTAYGEDDYGIDMKDDGRKAEDLEVVELDLVETNGETRKAE